MSRATWFTIIYELIVLPCLAILLNTFLPFPFQWWLHIVIYVLVGTIGLTPFIIYEFQRKKKVERGLDSLFNEMKERSDRGLDELLRDKYESLDAIEKVHFEKRLEISRGKKEAEKILKRWKKEKERLKKRLKLAAKKSEEVGLSLEFVSQDSDPDSAICMREMHTVSPGNTVPTGRAFYLSIRLSNTGGIPVRRCSPRGTLFNCQGKVISSQERLVWQDSTCDTDALTPRDLSSGERAFVNIAIAETLSMGNTFTITNRRWCSQLYTNYPPGIYFLLVEVVHDMGPPVCLRLKIDKGEGFTEFKVNKIEKFPWK
ncbi:MAG: hypothetical protein ACFFDP_07720 [Promethearchaeota archaeon]